MANGRPPIRVEIEFAFGTWTDVSQWVDLGTGVTVTGGRNSPYSPVQPRTMSLTLNNPDGRFTAGRQVLADGVTAHPYWPAVTPRRRVRYSIQVAGVWYVRFVGYIKAWPPQRINGTLASVPLAAVDRQAVLSATQPLASPLLQSLGAEQSLALQWTLGDASGSRSAAPLGPGYPMAVLGGTAGVTFGDSDGPGVGDGGSVDFAPPTSTSGQVLVATFPGVKVGAVELWVKVAAVPAVVVGLASIVGEGYNSWVGVDTSGHPFFATSTAATVTGPASVCDGNWHQIAVLWHVVGPTADLIVDGATVGSNSATFPAALVALGLGSQPGAYGGHRFTGKLAQVALYASDVSTAVPPHGVPNWADHAAAGHGYPADTVSQRVARYLGYGGVAAGDMVIDTSTVPVGAYQTSGKDVISAVQDLAATEGGGAAIYVDPTGLVRFHTRAARLPGAPLMTVDVADVDRDNWSPAYDDSTIVNQVTVQREGADAVLSTQTVTDDGSIATYQICSEQVSTWTTTDADAAALGQSLLQGPALRIGQLPIDFVTAAGVTYAQLVALDRGSRVRVTGLPADTAPATTLDLIVEGWTEVASLTAYKVTFDTSAADFPAWGVTDDGYYGRACEYPGTLTLAAALTAAQTTAQLATAAGYPTVTTAGADLPLYLLIGAEIVQVTVVTGSLSPQTVTIARGQLGTTATAQAAGSQVQVYPGATVVL